MSLLKMPIINNPLEQFEIIKLIAIESPIFGYIQIALTNIGLSLLLVIPFIICLHLLSTMGSKLGRSNTYNLGMESLFGFVLNLIRDQVGPAGQSFLPVVYSLFLFILFANLVGLVPYSFGATTQFALTLGLSSTIVLGTTFLGLSLHGLKFFSLFVPAGTPLVLVPLLVVIETVSYTARALSLGIRLAANLISGHILLKIIATFSWHMASSSLLGFLLTPFPILLLSALYVLEAGVAFLQAYVFLLLTLSYIKDTMALHGESTPSPSASS
jgi:F-type H+-transporting ATPase subunit a